MEGGAVSLELTFRESTPEPGTTLPRSESGSRSPKPRTGWYTRRSRRGGAGGGAGRGSTGSETAGWASTDADQESLRWNSLGSDEVMAFETCVMLPWLGDSVKLGAGEESVAAVAAGGSTGEGSLTGTSYAVATGRWAEIGVYAPEDGRRRREAMLIGFQSEKVPAADGEDGACVVAMRVEASLDGGVSVTEVCRTSLEKGHMPVSFNEEKTPPGAPTNGRATTEAVCADGWVRRWSVACTRGDLGGDGITGKGVYDLNCVDICQPFRGSAGELREEEGPSSTTLLAVASLTLLAVARPGQSQRVLAPLTSPGHVNKSRSASALSSAAVSATQAGAATPMLEVWSCARTPYPRWPFKKEGTVAMPGLRAGQAVEGMCWVSPEAGDERGAAISGHCLCVSVGGAVTVLAKENRQLTHALPGVLVAPNAEASGLGSGGDWTWSPVFRVANPSSLLTCRTAGLRDFCQVCAGEDSRS